MSWTSYKSPKNHDKFHLNLNLIFLYREATSASRKSLDIETGIETFRIPAMISRPVLRLSGLQSWYWDRFQDIKDCSLDMETGIETWYTDWYQYFYIFIFWSRCVLRLSELFQDFEIPKPANNTGMKTLKNRIPNQN